MIIKEKQNITLKVMIFVILFIIIGLGIIFRVIIIQTVHYHKYSKLVMQNNFRKNIIQASRGDIYTVDNVLLATNTTKYSIYLDLKTIKKNIFDQNIEKLCDSLSGIFKTNKNYFKNKLLKEYKKKNQYYLLANNIDYNIFERLKKFPIFNKGKHKGGFIVNRKKIRLHTINSFGERLLGIDNKNNKIGLEGAYSNYLKGEDVVRLEQRINSKNWKPINYWEKDPISGKDIYITIDMRMQDIVYTALHKQLSFFGADRGCAILMEVSTGKIKAMVNLKKINNNLYSDLRNYAVYETTEPGSTFKVMSLLAAMDDGYINPNTLIDIENGKWKTENMIVNDEYGNGLYNLENIITKSSNVGTSKLIYKYYKNNPEKFYTKLKYWKLNKKLGIDIPGESNPKFLSTKEKKWSLQSLITSSYGYGLHLTPLQILTFYNGIANRGKIVTPQFLERVEENGKIIYRFKPKIRVEKITSMKNLNQMKDILTKAVKNGTAKSIYTPNLKMAGKTGTTRLEYWKKSKLQEYQSSFCGFFPSNYPLFSCIIVIQKPNKKKGFYGGIVAAPVFKEIAGKVFLKMPLNVNDHRLNINMNFYKMILSNSEIKTLNNIKYIPNLIGEIGYKIIPQLENLGLKVKFDGTGKIQKQSLPKGSPVQKNQIIYLKLE